MITLVGLGPGHKDYILPIAIKKVKEASMVIGAQRNLDSIVEHSQKTMSLSVGFEQVGRYLQKHKEETITIVVSGDSGFYSMLAFVKRHVDETYIAMIPGISSLQYMFSKLNKGYENAKWISLHGRACDLASYVVEGESLGILTDKEQNNQYIARILQENNCKKSIIYVGERLSYGDEKITKLTVEEALSYEAHPLSVVVIEFN